MNKMPFDFRLKCEYSITTEDKPDLICEVRGEVCDGNIYSICQPTNCYIANAVCCYPIEDCENCPVRKNEPVSTKEVIE